MAAQDSQDEVIVFLRSPGAWPGRPERVDVLETHGAMVFLAGQDVLKIKRAVRLPYLDFSTLAARRRYCRRELEINAAGAAGIYRDVVAITREADGRLAIGGSGTPVEWAVRMHRFDEDQVLLRLVRAGKMTPELAAELADVIAASHARATVHRGAADPTEPTLRKVLEGIEAAGDGGVAAALARLRPAAERQLERSGDVRRRRAEAGSIRRCHGDLHLNNIVLWQGHPVPFDAIEFDEAMATTDTLYDLAFLLMDLERNGAGAAANAVLNRYLWRTGETLDVDGLAALPLYLGLRAAVRAMVALDRARVAAGTGGDAAGHAADTLDFARRCLTPPPARLIAVGGLSGTGKTTLAARLAPSIGALPGAVHLRSDMERKRMANLEPTQRLPPSAYTAASAEVVYARVEARARAALAAGHSVILDAVFSAPAERRAAEDLARRCGVPFAGLWLEGDAALLKARVAARTGDASDATPAIVEQQLGYALGEIAWRRIEAAGDAASVAVRAMAVVG